MCTQCTYRARPPHDQLILSLSLCLFLFCTREMIRHPYISQSTRGGDYPLSPLRLARTHINNAYTYPRLYVCVARGSGKRAVNKSVVEINPPIRAWHSQTVTGRSNVIKRIADRIKTISLSLSLFSSHSAKVPEREKISFSLEWTVERERNRQARASSRKEADASERGITREKRGGATETRHRRRVFYYSLRRRAHAAVRALCARELGGGFSGLLGKPVVANFCVSYIYMYRRV